ncbi:MAG: flavin monoamine oxidase family protein [Gammaproteobacteria bacterium]
MSNNEIEVAVVGGGAAGIAAARRLQNVGIECLVLEARNRLGGRAWTITAPSGSPLDLGCGWLHSADRNPWLGIAEAQGRTIDEALPPWMRPSPDTRFPPPERSAFREALRAFNARLAAAPTSAPDRPAAAFLERGCRWNMLISAVSTYISGTELERISARDLIRYNDSSVNWRVVEGYGATIAAHGADLSVVLGCAVHRIDRSHRRLQLETTQGTVTAEAAIVTLPTSRISESLFTPALPQKTEAALGLPLGFADKLFLSLTDPDDFEADSSLFGCNDKTATAAYHLRPFGRPLIEAYFGGSLARELERGGEAAFTDFALSELTSVFGSGFADRVAPLAIHCWGTDPLSAGAYSCALPGKAECRAALAAPVDERLFFAGEACSRSDYSTAHGAYLTGLVAADQAIAAREPDSGILDGGKSFNRPSQKLALGGD